MVLAARRHRARHGRLRQQRFGDDALRHARGRRAHDERTLKVALVAPSATNDLAFTQSMYSRSREPEGAPRT